MSNWKKTFKKIWNFIWHEDSVWSWIVNIIVAFLLIKFIFYPGIGLLLGTNLPVVAVISESMEHQGPFDNWWTSQALCGQNTLLLDSRYKCTQEKWYEQYNISKDEFLKYPMKNGFNKGDIIILKGSKVENLKVGDVIVFQSSLPYPIIHRIVSKDDVIGTKGDHNTAQIVDTKLNEKYIRNEQVIGMAWVKIPMLGYIKIWFVDALSCVTFQGCKF